MFSNAKAISVGGVSAKKITINGLTLWEKNGDLPYTPVSGIVSMTGTEHINTGASWEESCVWEITGYAISSGNFQYGYSAGGAYDVRKQASNYQLGGAYNPLSGTNIFASATSKYTYTVNDIETKDITAKLEVQGVSIERNKVGAYVAPSQNMRIGQQLYAGGIVGMVIQEAKRFIDGLLVLHYISCVYQDKVGMWDKLNNVFVANGGTGNYEVVELAQQSIQSLLTLGLQPESTLGEQQLQLTAIGAL